jgi:hypothetical protein
MTGDGSKLVKAGWGFGLGAAIGEATASYVSTGKVNRCTAVIRGVGAILLALMFP